MNYKPTQLLFIDATVNDIETLLQGALPGIEAHVLSGEQDGVAQITQILQHRPEVNTVHIVSHGSPGCLYLRNTRLCLDTLHHYTSQLQTWFTLSTSPSLHLYGCNVAAGDAGEEFIEKLHQLTGAEVAASRQVIGNGYWSLDVSSTGTNAPAPFNEAVLATWMGRLTPSINNLSNSSYTEQAPAIVLDNDISFSGGTDYKGGYIEFSLDTATSFDNLTLITDGSPSTVNSEISIFGDTVYIGNGTKAAVVGSVDPTFNGQNGQKLRINFSNDDFKNGNFNLGSPGSTTIPGWTSVNQQVKFGIDTIAGLPTPIDTTIPANAPNADKNTAADPGSMKTVLDSTQNDGSGNSVRLTSSGITTAQGYDIVRGPYIYSNSTAYLSVGDKVSFEWQAQGGNDAYDVYGYIVDVNTGYIETILNETGSSGNASTTWATKTITLSKAGEYKFVFVAGTYDFSGGTGAGAQVYIDDVTVTQAVPVLNDTHLSTIARRVQYNNTSDNPDTSKTLTVSVENNASETASATATINITLVNDAPTLTATAATLSNGTENTAYAITAVQLLQGFTDVDNDTLSVSGLTATNGTLTDNGDGTYTFNPAANYKGTVNLNYNVIDGNGGITPATAAFSLDTGNDAPTFKLSKVADNIFKISNSSSKSKLQVTLTGQSSNLVNELGVFTVDDAQGNINGIAPGAAGYAQAALDRAKVIFSAIANLPNGFNTDNLTHLLEFNSGDNFRFYLVKNSTTDGVRTGVTSLTDILFSDPLTQKITDLGNDDFSLASKDGSGNNAADFNNLVVKIQSTNDSLPLGTNLQGNSQGEVIDLRGVTSQVKADFVVNREAAFNNFIGFYQVADENGGIDTNGDGKADILTGQAGYTEAAVRGRVAGIDLTVNNQGSATFTGTFQPGSIFVPFIITNGTPNALLDSNSNNDPAVYFPFLGANADKVDHIRLLGNNVFGFEDLASGGDKDFNDMIVRVNLTIA
ncbi:DUF4347 domain-containing protein [Nostoc sp. UHCC 0926]|uniref:DUF4347 domain-containing protein n=1 Tax=unclassified Nostoc TaxID=2593658 RepID=UPI00235DEB07|nr:DUF4347 domain-containing protein [Nostoc sp. UHCC 0926]WDD31941.1 DUF4347 domain-containing protein [Nostoc sp. UHCC 0926]